MLILRLNDRHDRKRFDCGEPDLNRWLADVARQHMEKGVSSTFVAADNQESPEILGFYSLSLAELVNSDLPPRAAKRLPHRVPVFRLGRLAVSKSHWRQRIGETLLFDAIDRAGRISHEVGGIGLVVNAKPFAVNFYLQYGFEPMMDHPHNLFLPL